MIPTVYKLSIAKSIGHIITTSLVENTFKSTKVHIIYLFQKQPRRGVLRERCSENMQQIYSRTPMPKCYFNKVALPLFWIPILAWVLSCKFVAYFQITFFKEHLRTAASTICILFPPQTHLQKMKWSVSIKESFMIKILKLFVNISISMTGTRLKLNNL